MTARKKTPAQSKAINAAIMKRRGAAPFNDKSGAPRSTPIDKIDLESYWSIQGGLKWIGEELFVKNLEPIIASELRKILTVARENIKMRMQKHGNWVEKRDIKHEHDISDKLAACLLKVQGSSPAELKKMKGTVDKITGGLRE